MRTNRKVTIAAALLVLVPLVGCSDTDGDGDRDADPVAAAEARVDRAQGGVDDAQAALAEASGQFCDGAGDYLTAVDRYGGVVSDGEATVGAVEDAGKDLEEPRAAVDDDIEALQGARSDLDEARAELVDAQQALAEAQTGTTATDAPSTTTTTTTTTEPAVSPEAVDRLDRAEKDLKAAFRGVGDSTPLADATVQVNAAAVSVQVAWMQVLVDAGCLEDEQQAEAAAAVQDYTLALQADLAAAGFFEGAPDGVYGPATVDAVEALQTSAGLPVTGLVDRATAEALDEAVAASGDASASAETAQTAALQTVLTLTGFWTGPVDGQWTDALTAALKAFQTELGVEPTGVIDPATIAAAQQAKAAAATEATTTTSTAVPATTTTTTEP